MIDSENYFNPFPGLRAFEEDEEYLFFGREKQIDELLKRLRTTRFLSVVGSSGSGKSSLVKSGLLPSLYSGYMVQAGSSWRVAVFRPGNNPIGNMAEALAVPDVLCSDPEMQTMLKTITESTLRRSNRGLTEAVKQARLPEYENLLIVVDQFEELFRFSRLERNNNEDKRDSIAFINLLLQASQSKEMPIYIVLTMRSDFLGDCTEFPGLPEAINNGQYLIPRMNREELRQAITGPIAVGGAEISPRLLSQLLNDVGENPDQLPILQHALMRTWDYWQFNTDKDEPIDLKHYNAIGTMSQALDQHAEEAYAELKTNRKKWICEMMFRIITDKGSDSRGVRRPSKLSEICQLAEAKEEEVIEIINIFRAVGRSFLMPPIDVELNLDSVIDISHESLMRVWKRLINWVDDEINSANLYLRLASAAALYQEGKVSLWTDPELELAIRWRERNNPNVIWAQRYDPSFERAITFLDYSKQHADFLLQNKELRQKRRLKKARYLSIIFGLLTVVASFATVYAFIKEGEAKSTAVKLEVSEKQATEQRDKAIELQKLAEAEKQRAEDNARIAEAAKLNAVENAQKAELAKADALTNEKKALLAKEEARINADKAKNARDVAVKNEEIATEQRQIADNLKDKAERQRLVSEATALSVKALQQFSQGNNTIASILALHAFYIHKENSDKIQEPYNYEALYKIAEKLDKSDNFQLKAHEYSVRNIVLNNTQTLMSSCSDDGYVKIWKKENNKWTLKNSKKLSARIRAIAFSPDSKTIVAGTINGDIFSWDIAANNSPVLINKNKQHESLISNIETVDFKGDTYLFVGSNFSISIWKNNTFFESIDFSEKNTSFSVKTNGENLYLLTGGFDKLAKIWNIQTNESSHIKLIKQIEATKKIFAVCFSKNAEYFAIGTSDGEIAVWKFAGFEKIAHNFSGHKSAITSLAFNSENSQLASGSLDNTARLWLFKKAETEEAIILNTHTKWVWKVEFDNNSGNLLTACEDGIVRTFPLKAETLANKLCSELKTKLTREEMKNYTDAEILYQTPNCVSF